MILRHDVDARPENSLRFARWEHDNGIRGTYYFRSSPDGFDKSTIRKIASLGHETGYHYETLDQVLKPQLAAGNWQLATFWGKIKTLWYAVLSSPDRSGQVVKLRVTKKHPPDKQSLHHAYQLFTVNLRKLRRITPVSTICMHGSPLSPYDNRDIWKLYDYRRHDILGEPYLDTDFSQVAYLTDTGRKWNNLRVSIRDKVYDLGTERRRDGGTGRRVNPGTPEHEIWNLKSGTWNLKSGICPPAGGWNLEFKSTLDLIHAINEGTFPEKAMLTLHPQRWNDDWLPWLQELILQSIKNPLKRILVRSTTCPDPSGDDTD